MEEGRATFQRILTFTSRSIIHKVAQVLMLLAGLIISGGAVLTPLLMVMLMVGGDFFALSSSTDNVHASPAPNVWRIRNLTITGVVLGFCDLIFCVGSLAAGRFILHLDNHALQTLTIVTMAYSGQAIFYVSRERRRFWRSCPGHWLFVGSFLEIAIFSTLAGTGILMAPLPLVVLASVFAGAVALGLVLDSVKVALFRRYPIV